MSKLKLIVVICVFLMGCNDDGATFSTTLSVQNSNDQEVTVFASGETIRLVLTVTNLTSASQTLNFRDAQQQEFLALIWENNAIIWQYAIGGASVLTSLTFSANETKMFVVDWNQLDSNLNLVDPGTYRMQGYLPTNDEIANTQKEYFLPTELRSMATLISIQ